MPFLPHRLRNSPPTLSLCATCCLTSLSRKFSLAVLGSLPRNKSISCIHYPFQLQMHASFVAAILLLWSTVSSLVGPNHSFSMPQSATPHSDLIFHLALTQGGSGLPDVVGIQIPLACTVNDDGSCNSATPGGPEIPHIGFHASASPLGPILPYHLLLCRFHLQFLCLRYLMAKCEQSMLLASCSGFPYQLIRLYSSLQWV